MIFTSDKEEKEIHVQTIRIFKSYEWNLGWAFRMKKKEKGKQLKRLIRPIKKV